MSISPITALLISKVIPFLLSFAALYFSYQLFRKNKTLNNGEINAKWSDFTLTLKNNPPGTIFLIAGLILSIVTILSKSTIEEKKKTNSEQTTEGSSITPYTIAETPVITTLNIDSVILLAKKQQLQKKHLDALKYLYLIKGYCISSKCDSPKIKLIDTKITENEELIILQLNKNKAEKISSEETRSIKIKDTNDVEIK